MRPSSTASAWSEEVSSGPDGAEKLCHLGAEVLRLTGQRVGRVQHLAGGGSGLLGPARDAVDRRRHLAGPGRRLGDVVRDLLGGGVLFLDRSRDRGPPPRSCRGSGW